MKLNPNDYRIEPGAKVRLDKFKPDDTGGLEKEQARARFAKLREKLAELQELLYADGSHALLVILQAMDTGGKDSAIRQVFRGVNPQGCKVASFKAPNDVELRHDFLWRIHQNVPRLGHICIHNRSHYEDVLVVRVKELLPKDRWKPRYEHINAFERMLHDEGTVIVKFYLHISKDYQRQRLQRRLDDPAKQWKFEPADLTERRHWDDYMQAYDDVLERCSTDYAPWYVIPGEHHWYRNLLMTQILVDTLRGLKLRYPEPKFDPKQIVIE